MTNNILSVALGEYGVEEISGSRHNKRVLDYFKKVGHAWIKDDETAWCAAYVGWVLEQCGHPSTEAVNARSYESYGKKTTSPQPGDIAVFWRESPNSWKGHVGFYIKHDSNYVWVLGGNQSNEVNIQKYPIARLLGYRTVDTNPAEEMVPKSTVQGIVTALLSLLGKNATA